MSSSDFFDSNFTLWTNTKFKFGIDRILRGRRFVTNNELYSNEHFSVDDIGGISMNYRRELLHSVGMVVAGISGYSAYVESVKPRVRPDANFRTGTVGR
jgi:hypothetical protein